MKFFEYVILQRGRSLQCFMKHAQKLYFFAFFTCWLLSLEHFAVQRVNLEADFFSSHVRYLKRAESSISTKWFANWKKMNGKKKPSCLYRSNLSPKLQKGILPVLSVNYGQLKRTKSKKVSKVVLSSLSLLIEPYSAIFSSVTGGPRWHQRRQKTRFSFTSPYVIYCYPAIPQPDPLGRAASLLSDYYTTAK